MIPQRKQWVGLTATHTKSPKFECSKEGPSEQQKMLKQGKHMGVSGTDEKQKLCQTALWIYVCVTPGTRMFGNVWKIRVRQHEKVSFMTSIQVNQGSINEGCDLRSYCHYVWILWPLPCTLSINILSPHPSGKIQPSERSCPRPSHSQRLHFWATIHRLCSAAVAYEHLPGCKIPGARSRRERATTCMFCYVWLISNESSNVSDVPGQLSNILQLAEMDVLHAGRWNEDDSDVRGEEE